MHIWMRLMALRWSRDSYLELLELLELLKLPSAPHAKQRPGPAWGL